MTSRSERALAALLAGLVLAAPATARADGRGESEDVKKARAEFVAATDHVKNARWGEALAAFERSAALRPHALTTYNIGACEQALGRYTRARRTFAHALEANEAGGGRELPKSFAEDAKRWIAEIDGMLVRASVTLSPADASLLVDGAPLTRGDGGVLVAGLASSDAAVKAPGARFTVLLDPGDHLFAVSRAGYGGAVVRKSMAAGSTPELKLDLESLPATIRIAANRPGAAVAIDGLDVGVAPVEISRPAGTYRVAVRKTGFVPYLTNVRVSPGDQPTLQATLAEETTPVTKRFWFWAVAATVVAGAAAGTYFLTRPDPERPAPDGGGLGWVVSVPAPGAR